MYVNVDDFQKYVVDIRDDRNASDEVEIMLYYFLTGSTHKVLLMILGICKKIEFCRLWQTWREDHLVYGVCKRCF